MVLKLAVAATGENEQEGSINIMNLFADAPAISVRALH
jgi:hypothetical protein